MNLAKVENGIVMNVIKVEEDEKLSDWPGYVLGDALSYIGGTYDGSKFLPPAKTQETLDFEAAKIARQAVRDAKKPVEDRLRALDLNALDPVIADLIRHVLK